MHGKMQMLHTSSAWGVHAPLRTESDEDGTAGKARVATAEEHGDRSVADSLDALSALTRCPADARPSGSHPSRSRPKPGRSPA